ncbi:MAG: hypothetical protein WBI07_03280 [Mobilitalea sp.]
MLPGVYQAVKTNGEEYYRASITYLGKHISLGSYAQEEEANQSYQLAAKVLFDSFAYTIESYPKHCILSFHKWVILINFKDNQIYFKNPIYLHKRYFFYYIDTDINLRFDVEDLFYYANHKILKRGGHLFVSDYGMQVNILSRYGIKNYAVCGRDYVFMNGDTYDFSYHNIAIVNKYFGVTKISQKGRTQYLAKIHINGDYLIGRFSTENEAAIAYNKAVLLLKNSGFIRNYQQNFIESINEITYASIYQKIRVSKKLLHYIETLNIAEPSPAQDKSL